jgi:predicted nucleic acid-binding protein
MPVNFVYTIDTTIFTETSRLKATYNIPLGDCIGLATAIKTEGVFVTADHSDFEEIEKTAALSFFWFR